MQFTLELQAISGFRENLPNVNFYTQSASLEMALFSVIKSYCARCFFAAWLPLVSNIINDWAKTKVDFKIFVFCKKNTYMLLARCFFCKNTPTKKLAFHGDPSKDRKAGCEL